MSGTKIVHGLTKKAYRVAVREYACAYAAGMSGENNVGVDRLVHMSVMYAARMIQRENQDLEEAFEEEPEENGDA